MNGYFSHTNGDLQYNSYSTQSENYPPNSKIINYSNECYDHYDSQQIKLSSFTTNSVHSEVPINDLGKYSYNNSMLKIDQNSDIAVIRNYDYIEEHKELQSPDIRNQQNGITHIPLTLQKSITLQNAYLYPQPHITHQPNTIQAPNTISEHMNNIQLSSQSPNYIIDLMERRNIFLDDLQCTNIPKTSFSNNCDEHIMQCTLNTIPMEANILSKCRLPLGIHIQPFRDSDMTLLQTNTIVRCCSCRTYINPFVSLTDHQRRWYCNVCGRVNDLPDEFMYDSITKTYGSPLRRPELQYCNVEYTANVDYTVRPPMAAMYVFCFDVSQAAISSGYLRYVCDALIENLEKIQGNSRKQIAFLSYNSCLHYYHIPDNSYKSIIWSDITEVDLPVSEDLLVSINDKKDIIIEFLHNLPLSFQTSNDTGNCMGCAIQAAVKLITHNGGRISVMNASLPNVGLGSLLDRKYQESLTKLINPTTDFYKTLAIQCANNQISVDLFCINREYSDIASFAVISRYSAGAFHYYGNFNAVTDKNHHLEGVEKLDFNRFIKDFRRYLTRKIGFEAVMRTRCTKGLELTSFLGNMFMRSTDVIAIPVVNPDTSYSIQFKINNSLSEWNYVVIQCALLYTTSDSERRIRIHTMCLPLTDKIEEVFQSANSPAIAGLIAKIAVDKFITDGLSIVRDAFVNSLVDPLKAFDTSVNQCRGSQTLPCPYNMRGLAPLILGLLKISAFREKTELIDDRVAMLESLRSLPLTDILHRIYPKMVSVENLAENILLKTLVDINQADDFPQPFILNLTSAEINRDGAYVLDVGECFYLILGHSVSSKFLKYGFGIDSISQIPKEGLITNFEQCNLLCRRMKMVLKNLGGDRGLGTSVITILSEYSFRKRLLSHMVEDKLEDSLSYFEFLRNVQSLVFS